MISVNRALYLSAFSLFSLAFVKGQNKVPFGVVKAEEGYANVRVHKDDYRKIVDKIRMRKGDVFVYVKPAPGETEWIWIKYPEKQDDDKPFVRYESLEKEATCLITKTSVDESWKWHKKLSHLNFNSINELAKKELVRGLPNMLYSSDGLCDACQKSKQRRVSFKSKTEFSIYEPYHMLHLDLFGPVNIMSINKKRYTLVIVDDFTRYTWVYFLHRKDEAPEILLDHRR